MPPARPGAVPPGECAMDRGRDGMTRPRATRDLKDATAEELAALRDAATVLVEHERRISPRVLTDLCLIREETTAELGSRLHPVRSDQQAS